MSIADNALSADLAARDNMIECRGVKKWFGDFQAIWCTIRRWSSLDRC